MAHKRGRRSARPLYLAIAAILCTHCLLFWAARSTKIRDGHRTAVVKAVDSVFPQPAAIRTRPRAVYPYSVIRGGAYSPEELNVALQADPLAKVHYANFDRSRTRVIRASTSSSVYVSYRKGNRILWTRRPVRLPEGEALLTDGTHLARARCGNRVSFTPPQPALAGEPGLDLDVPEPSTVSPPESYAVPNMVYEIFPPVLTSAVPAGTVPGPARETLGPPAGGLMPMSTGGSSSPGYTFPPVPETTPPAPPSTGPIDFTLPPPPAWIAPSETMPLPPAIVITPTPGGTPPVPTWILPPYPTITPSPGTSPFPTVGPTPETPTTPETPPPPVPPSRPTPPETPPLLPPDYPPSPPDTPPTPPTPPDTPAPEPSTVVLLLSGVAFLTHRQLAARRGGHPL